MNAGTPPLRRNRRAWTAAAIPLALALLLAGCPTPDTEPPPGIALERSCANPEYGFQVHYPAGWVTNEANGLPPCSAFDPESTAMPAAGEIPTDIAIVIHRDRVPFDRVTDFQADFTADARSREATTVDGRRAVVVELEHTGQGMYPSGQRQHAYFVDLGESTLIGMTHDVAAASPPPYTERQRILDAMMASLRFDD